MSLSVYWILCTNETNLFLFSSDDYNNRSRLKKMMKIKVVAEVIR